MSAQWSRKKDGKQADETKTKKIDPLDKALCHRHRDLVVGRVGKDRALRFVTREIMLRLRVLKPDVVKEARASKKPLQHVCCKLGDAALNDALQGKPIKLPKPPRDPKSKKPDNG